MKITLGTPPKARNKPKAAYIIDIETIEGDMDDEHHMEWEIEDEAELRDIIIHAEVMKKCYPNGRGGTNDYVGPYFEKYFKDEINYDRYGFSDSFRYYTVIYRNDQGQKVDVKIEMDEEMIEEINNPKMSDEDKEEMNYPKPQKA